MTDTEVIETTAVEAAPADEFEVGDADPGAQPIDAEAAAEPEADQPAAVVEVGAEVAVVDPATLAPAADTEMANLGHSELVLLMRQAELLSAADIIPKPYRGKPANVLVASIMGRKFGWDALTAMSNGHVIEGVWSMRPEAMLALARRAGHRIEGDATATEAWARGTRSDDGTAITVRWTIEDARTAGLLNKDNWKHYPASMLWARCIGQLCRMLFPDVLLGVSYVPEELGADVNEQGDVIDVSEVAPTRADGWGSAAPEPVPEVIEWADPDDLVQLRDWIAALPDALRVELRQRWNASDSNLKDVPVGKMPKAKLKIAQAMVNAFWAKARQAGLDRDTEVARMHAASAADAPAQPPQDAEPAAEPAPAPTPPEAAPEPPQDDEAPEPVDWMEAAKRLAGMIRDLAAERPDVDGAELDRRVKKLHHTRVNALIAEAGETHNAPPESPIDFRRLAISYLVLSGGMDLESVQ